MYIVKKWNKNKYFTNTSNEEYNKLLRFAENDRHVANILFTDIIDNGRETRRFSFHYDLEIDNATYILFNKNLDKCIDPDRYHYIVTVAYINLFAKNIFSNPTTSQLAIDVNLRMHQLIKQSSNVLINLIEILSEYFHYDSLTRYEDEFEHLQSQAISNYNENVVYESQYQQLYENLLEGFINNIALITKLIGMVQMITLENGETTMKLIFNLFVNVLSISYIEVSLDDSTSTVLKEKELKDALITHCSSMNSLECSENAVLRYIFMKGIGS